MKLHPPRSTRTDTLFPYTTLFRAKPWYVTTATLARRQPVGTLGAGMILFMVLTAAFADVLSPYNPVDARFSWMLQAPDARSEEHTSELQSLMRNSYAVFCLKKKNQ